MDYLFQYLCCQGNLPTVPAGRRQTGTRVGSGALRPASTPLHKTHLVHVLLLRRHRLMRPSPRLSGSTSWQWSMLAHKALAHKHKALTHKALAHKALEIFFREFIFRHA